jgi:hypothetical protein
LVSINRPGAAHAFGTGGKVFAVSAAAAPIGWWLARLGDAATGCSSGSRERPMDGLRQPQGSGSTIGWQGTTGDRAGGVFFMEQQTQGATAFGFLTAVDSPAHGVFGGYLLVDAMGRPLEFHCTAPVKVSRAQQILYGASLPGHLHGQQIGAALLAEGSVIPTVVLTDHDAMLAVRPHTSLPVALVRRRDEAVEPPPGAFAMGEVCVSPHVSDAAAAEALRRRLEDLGSSVDLTEPFERIRAAIEEAQRH